MYSVLNTAAPSITMSQGGSTVSSVVDSMQHRNCGPLAKDTTNNEDLKQRKKSNTGAPSNKLHK